MDPQPRPEDDPYPTGRRNEPKHRPAPVQDAPRQRLLNSERDPTQARDKSSPQSRKLGRAPVPIQSKGPVYELLRAAVGSPPTRWMVRSWEGSKRDGQRVARGWPRNRQKVVKNWPALGGNPPLSRGNVRAIRGTWPKVRCLRDERAASNFSPIQQNWAR
jgi:hypothetical protein